MQILQASILFIYINGFLYFFPKNQEQTTLERDISQANPLGTSHFAFIALLQNEARN